MRYKGKTGYTRVWQDMSGPGKTLEQVMLPDKTYVIKGMTYKIPYEKKTGKVPMSAIYQRFLDVNAGADYPHKRNINVDLAKQADVMHIIPEGGFTPDELIATGWWQHPQNSDIYGVDDPNTSVLQILDGVSKTAQGATKKIAIIAPEGDNNKIKKVLTDNFTGSELKRAVKSGGIVIMTDNPGPGASGYYRGRQPGVDTPLIVLEPGCDEDTITHEFVHHLRRVDDTRKGVARTPYPMDEKGYTLAGFIGSKDEKRYRNLEEAATVAEATCRTREPTRIPTGYYEYTAGDQSIVDKYTGDRAILISGKKVAPKRGYRATGKVNKEFGKTNISTMKYNSREPAAMTAKVLTPIEEKKGNATTGKGKGKVGATANAKPKKKAKR